MIYITQLLEHLKDNTCTTIIDNFYGNTTLEQLKQLANYLETNNNVLQLSLVGISYVTPNEHLNVTKPIDWAETLSNTFKNNKCITHANFYASNITDFGISLLTDSLMFNTTLVSLNVGHCLITFKGVKAISLMLRDNSTLKSLNLSLNSISGDTTEELMKSLSFNTSLTSINLTGCGLDVNSFNIVKNKTLKTLSINIVNTQNIEPFCDFITNSGLECLILDHSQLSLDNIRRLAKVLNNNTNLKTVSLRMCGVEDLENHCFLKLLERTIDVCS